VLPKPFAQCRTTLKCKIKMFCDISEADGMTYEGGVIILSRVYCVEKLCAMNSDSWPAVMWIAKSREGAEIQPEVPRYASALRA
jgi:hypothetical protein